ncbi:carbohydrate esterase family 16 protein [Cylindrobasidium torrendii FP15055 ss-10]|uniref:Carbohydrate esterase family 16 protein n=1 Tax=Cylindrobasidium torrendii FP15055 ss-10 TaxID=1314674 RepID=A0A0D7BLX3_9AGAR|nr:carbohydrate esterase family 16 protein [Cylindrobasidium torrendii FP15055 ss-10]
MVALAILVVLSSYFSTLVSGLSPTCGSISSDTVVNVNAGIDLSEISTIAAFGDGYTSGDKTDGSELSPAVQSGTDPKAGGRYSNGPLWIEYFASNISASLRDYAVPRSLVSNDLYTAGDTADDRDFVSQSGIFMSQKSAPDPDSTLIVLYEGMEDFLRGEVNMTDAANNVVFQILKLSSSPFYGKNFLIVDSYGRGTTSEAGEAWKQEIWTGARTAYNALDISLAFADLGELLDAVVAAPTDFGYENVGPCTVDAETTEGQCSSPNTTVFYIEDYPSTTAHNLMAEFVLDILENCTE